MKKYDLLKKIGFVFFIVILLSWVIPSGVYSNGSFSTSNLTTPIGLHNIISAPIIAIATFISIGLLILAIGGFYGVLNKTGVYSKIVDNIIKKFKDKNFLIVSVLVISLLSAFVGSNSAILILIPFFATILLKLGYTKITTMAATIGSMLIGNLCSVTGTDVWSNFAMAFGLKVSQNIIVKLIMLAIILTLYVMMLMKKSKNEKSEKNDIPLYEENKGKKESTPLLVVSILFFILILIGSFHFKEILGLEFFDELHEYLMSAKIGKYPLFANILGSVTRIGYWGDYDIIISLLILSLIISWLYNLKLVDTIDAFVDSAKKMLPTAIYAMLSSMVLIIVINLGSNFVFTMVNTFLSISDKFSFIGTVGSALVASPIYSNFYVLLGNFYQAFSLNDANTIPTVAFIFQTIYGIIMFLVPTSMLLLTGLTYLNVSYKDWIKYIWKFILVALAIVLVIAFIMATFL